LPAGSTLWEKARPLEVTAGQQYPVVADRVGVIDQPGDNAWRTCRLRLGQELKGNFPAGTPWRGEILIQCRGGDSENAEIGVRNMILQ